MDVNAMKYRSQDLVVLKKTICEELARVKEVLARLQFRHQQKVAPDLSKDELLEIFYEEHERLFRQLQAIDASLLKAEEGSAPGPSPGPSLLEQHRQIERWRNTLAAPQSTMTR